MSEYASIKNLYKMDEATHKRGPEQGFSNPAFGSVTNWLITEKVDGMNIRVTLEDIEGIGPQLRLAGRSDKAQLPGDLRTYLEETFTIQKMVSAFNTNPEAWDEASTVLPAKAILYGEGYGPGIQKVGQHYGGTKRFILFDVWVDGFWLDWDDVVDVAQKLGIEHVPVLLRGATLETAKSLVHESRLLSDPAHVEGFVARTEPQLFDKFGQRVMFKYKVRDL
jgi:hypothetical protein